MIMKNKKLLSNMIKVSLSTFSHLGMSFRKVLGKWLSSNNPSIIHAERNYRIKYMVFLDLEFSDNDSKKSQRL